MPVWNGESSQAEHMLCTQGTGVLPPAHYLQVPAGSGPAAWYVALSQPHENIRLK